MTIEDGRNAKQPYRVRVGGVWYWVDPTVPASEIEPGDTVVIYPVDGGATFAVLRSGFTGLRRLCLLGWRAVGLGAWLHG